MSDRDRLAQLDTVGFLTGLIVTIDGPSGSGKSTVSRAVAAAAGLPHFDTGAFYRVATLAALREGVDLEDQAEVARAVESHAVDYDDGVVRLDGTDVSNEIRGEAVTDAVSTVAAHPDVRVMLVEAQRRWVESRGGRAVVEGRDIGSVVFPDAQIKIFLDARPEARAARRSRQSGAPVEKVLEDMRRRDAIDSTRTASPLTVPVGAAVVDTSEMGFDEVVGVVHGMIRALG